MGQGRGEGNAFGNEDGDWIGKVLVRSMHFILGTVGSLQRGYQ